MNVLPTIQYYLEAHTPHCLTWIYSDDVDYSPMLELIIKNPIWNVLVRITQQDNIIVLCLLCDWAILQDYNKWQHATTITEEIDLLDPNFLDRICRPVYRQINLYMGRYHTE